MSGMTLQAIEMRVLSAVNSIISGRRVEDSRIECKSEWPLPKKARQLAGHANSANGEEIIWIIGINEETGQITNPTSPDLAIWWSQICGVFDENVHPEMIDIVVPVGDGQTVTALVFSTDRAPYVVAHGSELDVPVRDGTRTRSAHRHELLRILQPSITLPNVTVSHANVSGSCHPPSPEKKGGTTEFSLRVHLFFELEMDRSIFIPYNQLKWELKPPPRLPKSVKPEDLSGSLLNLQRGGDKATQGQYGIIHRFDGELISGPAIAELYGQITIPGNRQRQFNGQEILIAITIGIAGSVKPVTVNATLQKRRGIDDLQPPRYAVWWTNELG